MACLNLDMPLLFVTGMPRITKRVWITMQIHMVPSLLHDHLFDVPVNHTLHRTMTNNESPFATFA